MPDARSSAACGEAASPLVSLPDAVLLHIFSHLHDVTTLGRVAATARLPRTLALDCMAWIDVSMPASSIRTDRALRYLGRHTRAVRLSNPECGAHRHRFCQLVLPDLHGNSFSAGCGGLLDAGARVLLRRCPSLRELSLPGMGHLTSATLACSLECCPLLETLVLRGCERICTGFAVSESYESLAPRPRLKRLDLSHADVRDSDLIALLALCPSLRSLQVNFNEELTDAALDALPPTLARMEALGCERLSWSRMEVLREQLGIDERGAACLRCDDSAVLSVGAWSEEDGDAPTDVAQSLYAMLSSYRAEQARWK